MRSKIVMSLCQTSQLPVKNNEGEGEEEGMDPRAPPPPSPGSHPASLLLLEVWAHSVVMGVVGGGEEQGQA